MGLSATIKTAIDKAFVAADDLVSVVTYYDVTPGAYDVATDVTASTAVTYTDIEAALVKLKETEQAWFPADAIVQKALIPYTQLPLVPELHDYLTIGGVTWQVDKSTPVPGRGVHILYIRKT